MNQFMTTAVAEKVSALETARHFAAATHGLVLRRGGAAGKLRVKATRTSGALGDPHSGEH